MSILLANHEITTWLRDRLSAYCDRPTNQVLPDVQLTELGFTSVYALALCGAIEDELGLFLEAAAFAECRTVSQLGTVLEQHLKAGTTT